MKTLSLISICFLFFALSNQLVWGKTVIVYSEDSQRKFYDEKSYAQLFVSIQYQLTLAGLPFELKSLKELNDPEVLDHIDLLILPQISHVHKRLFRSLGPALTRAFEQRKKTMHLMVIGQLFRENHRGGNLRGSAEVRERFFPFEEDRYINGESFQVRFPEASPLWKAKDLTLLEREFSSLWFPSTKPDSKSGKEYEAWPLLEVSNEKQRGLVPAWALEHRQLGNRIIQISDPLLAAQLPLVWRSALWLKHGSDIPGKLNVSRFQNIFLSRTDLDLMMEKRIQDLILRRYTEVMDEWKKSFNFVGSHYITIGNSQSKGQWTDWNKALPYYQKWIEQGGEIGTHSYTHPHYVDKLSDKQFKFEFQESRKIIEKNLKIKTPGGAIPGNRENLEVARKFGRYLDYISGEFQGIDHGFLGSFGKLHPEDSHLYFGPNMTFDFTAISFQRHSPEYLLKVWKDEYMKLGQGQDRVIIHWPWHDYGVLAEDLISYIQETEGALSRWDQYLLAYRKWIFDDFLAHISQSSIEYVTGIDLAERINFLRELTLIELPFENGKALIFKSVENKPGDSSVRGRLSYTVSVPDSKFMNASTLAYHEDEIFLESGRERYQWTWSDSPIDRTHISFVDQRVELKNVEGNGRGLNFEISGDGKIVVSTKRDQLVVPSCSSNVEKTFLPNQVVFKFNQPGTHRCELNPIDFGF